MHPQNFQRKGIPSQTPLVGGLGEDVFPGIFENTEWPGPAPLRPASTSPKQWEKTWRGKGKELYLEVTKSNRLLEFDVKMVREKKTNLFRK